MLPILTAAQMRKVDKETIEGLGLPGAVLMESAGRSVYNSIREHPALEGALRPVVLCGGGNNGGDGFVVARYLRESSLDGYPLVFLCSHLRDLEGDAALMARVAVNLGLDIVELTEENLDRLDEALTRCDLVVDALLGTGATGPPRGLIGRVVEAVSRHDLPAVAVDAPTGVEMDTGHVPGGAIECVLTVTFGAQKTGHCFYPGRAVCGDIDVADIGFPASILQDSGCNLFITQPHDVRVRMPLRLPDSHKGDYGKLLVVGGSTGLTGAVVMASEAAFVMGAGMVTAGVPASLNSILEQKMTEVMTLPLADSGKGAIQSGALESVAEFLESDMDVLALGPGLGRDEGTVEFVRALARRVALPTVIDADGLNAFAGADELLEQFEGSVVITPHPGEMSRLSGKPAEEIIASPVETAREYASGRGVAVVLKGAPTVIAAPDGTALVNPTGGPAMSKAGSGDVLTGIIAGLLAQGVEAFDAAFCGVYLHGLAGDMAAEAVGDYSVLAGDMTASLPSAIEKVCGDRMAGG